MVKKIILFAFKNISVALVSLLIFVESTNAGKLAIVIDDFGYRPKQENKILQMSNAISVAILPDAPYAYEIATKAHKRGHEILIHLPMAPFSNQPLEQNTLHPDMNLEEIEHIIHNAIANVPYAVGVNNHMGSKMTSSLPAMLRVMQVLDQHNLYFLDSMTSSNSQATRAASSTQVKVIKRRVFFDDIQNETEIRKQFNLAINLAYRNGSTIAIGHPHPTTIRVLQQMLSNLPADITLVRPSQMLNESKIDRLIISKQMSNNLGQNFTFY